MAVAKQVPPIWTTGWTDVLNTGTWRSAIPVHQKRSAPCHGACPVNGEIPVWTQLLRKEQYYEAWLELVKNNPFPAVTGRICHHPCEVKCNRGQYDGAVAINAMEQFIGDMALEEQWDLPSPSISKDQRIAVIGGGPAGLSCAYQLRLQGYQVTVIDANPQLGGVLRYGIPEYRLPKEILDQEIQRLIALDLDIQLNRFIKPEELERLDKEYNAVFLAIGANHSKTLPQFPMDGKQIIAGLDFLRGVIEHKAIALGGQVVVIGGGSVAMDVARSARRLGSQIKVLALENKETLPAQADEVVEAMEEEIMIIDGAMAQTVQISENKINLMCTKVVLDQSAPAGVFKPIILPGTEFQIQADQVIIAIGQDPELTGWEEKFEINNNIIAMNSSGTTSRDGVFAGGDAASTERYASSAIGQGKKSAYSIIRYLNGEETDNISDTNDEEVAFEDINTFYFPLAGRENRGTVDVQARLSNFNEVRTGFTPQQSQSQAERCFSCGNCLECDNCYYFCPDMAVAKEPTLKEHYRVLEQYCKGCGSCVEECPRGAVVLKEEAR